MHNRCPSAFSVEKAESKDSYCSTSTTQTLLLKNPSSLLLLHNRQENKYNLKKLEGKEEEWRERRRKEREKIVFYWVAMARLSPALASRDREKGESWHSDEDNVDCCRVVFWFGEMGLAKWVG